MYSIFLLLYITLVLFCALLYVVVAPPSFYALLTGAVLPAQAYREVQAKIAARQAAATGALAEAAPQE